MSDSLIDERTRQLILTEEEKSEKLINYWRLGLSFFFLAITKIISPEIPPRSITILYSVSFMYMLYGLFMLIFLRKGKYSAGVKYYNLFVDVILLTVTIWMFGTFRTFKTEAFLLYFMWVALGSMRFSLGLTLFAGGLCVGGYLLIIFAGVSMGTIETGTITESFTTQKVSLLNQAVKVIYLAFVALGLSYGSYSYMRLARKTREQEIAIERQSLRAQKMEAVGFLAGGIAHDFNNALAIISNNLHLVKTLNSENKETLKKLEAAGTAAMKASNLTKQLLTFSKGGDPVMKTMLLQRTIEDTQRISTAGSSVKCEIKPLPHDLRVVNADEGQLHQVFSNLLINAVQASALGGIIHMEAENLDLEDASSVPLPPGRYVRISITDYGAGIAEENLQRIFDPYFTTKDQGSGLGLASAYSIIKRHSGLIEVESAPGKGSTFRVYLPASDEPYYEEEATDDIADLSGLRILIMDDQQAFLDSTGAALNMTGHHVSYASNGMEAIEHYGDAMRSGSPFDLVIMDLVIPGGMGGAEAVKRLLEIDPKIRAIVSSGYSNDPVMANYRTYGFKGILPKPFTMEQMQRELKKVFAG
jgi:signal transduction histidine kinase/ActR/RegA family two-component response regulator